MRTLSRAIALALVGGLAVGCTRTALPADVHVAGGADLAGSADLAGDDLGGGLDALTGASDLGGACGGPASPDATITGHTPSGPFSGRFAWAFYVDCASRAIVEVAADATLPAPGTPQLRIAWPSPPVLGDQPVTVHVVDGAGALDANGRVTLTVVEPAVSSAPVALAGTLAVNELGGKLTLMGDFSASRCRQLDELCP